MITRKMWAVVEDGKIEQVFTTRESADALANIFHQHPKVKRCEVRIL